MKWLPTPPHCPAASFPPSSNTTIYITLVSFSFFFGLTTSLFTPSECSVTCRRSKRLSVSGSFVRRGYPYGPSRIDRCLFYAICCLGLTAIWELLQVRVPRSPRAGPSLHVLYILLLLLGCTKPPCIYYPYLTIWPKRLHEIFFPRSLRTLTLISRLARSEVSTPCTSAALQYHTSRHRTKPLFTVAVE